MSREKRQGTERNPFRRSPRLTRTAIGSALLAGALTGGCTSGAGNELGPKCVAVVYKNIGVSIGGKDEASYWAALQLRSSVEKQIGFIPKKGASLVIQLAFPGGAGYNGNSDNAEIAHLATGVRTILGAPDMHLDKQYDVVTAGDRQVDYSDVDGVATYYIATSSPEMQRFMKTDDQTCATSTMSPSVSPH